VEAAYQEWVNKCNGAARVRMGQSISRSRRSRDRYSNSLFFKFLNIAGMGLAVLSALLLLWMVLWEFHRDVLTR